MPKTVVFCLPGKSFSSNFLNSWTELLLACKDFDVAPIVKTAYNPNIYKVRNLCLMADPNIEGKQLPFGGKIKYDYIMWIDSDSVFSPSDFKPLLDRMEKDKNLHILSALYLGVSGKYTAGQVIKNKEKDILESKFLTSQDLTGKSELIKVDFVGMGFMMVRYGVFEALEYPWFYPLVVGANGQVTGFTTEDVSFCVRAQAKGYSVYIDPKVKIGHEKLIVLK